MLNHHETSRLGLGQPSTHLCEDVRCRPHPACGARIQSALNACDCLLTLLGFPIQGR